MKKLCFILLIIALLSPTFFIGVLGEMDENTSNNIGSKRYEDGYRYNINGWIYLHIEGEPYERGYPSSTGTIYIYFKATTH
ncbi:MAG: hypothetical protein KAR55_06345 [Thermoplasmatales archaeon]|nr:hypothetical protein [Thermoplasmatales archaeon]